MKNEIYVMMSTWLEKSCLRDEKGHGPLIHVNIHLWGKKSSNVIVYKYRIKPIASTSNKICTLNYRLTRKYI